MTHRTSSVAGPFIDSYSVGFRLYRKGEINWKHRTIAGVSWNGQEQEAFFFNAEGMALPLKADPWRLPEWIREHAVRREFASVHGDGYFAMKEGRRKALKAAGLNDWVTYWLVDQSGGFANDAEVWQRHVDADLATERAECETVHTEMRLQSDRADYIQQCVAERLEHLAVTHRRRCAEDQKILAWLKGEVPPPLFAKDGNAP
ncbi:hypothetical protein [Pseudomonas caspiana]|uniref:Uncharacterized protein n=1 Tax=Pseudomonas caspiana TaxID=1451454 RepID=A0A1Y3P5L7_9PSED|nr:hypothetical protein [Pseudomonas caspiana]OUM75145.1 hypothetical protein AUC60_02785 [Pseudomonas caspiana]